MEKTTSWDPAVGLWIEEGPGHTGPVSKLPRVRNGRYAVTRLIREAQRGSLAQTPVAEVLRALEAMQVRDRSSERDGCFRWYWEEKEPVDTNAAFFIGMGLLLLAKVRDAELDAESRQRLHGIFPPLLRWFSREIAHRMFHYPNKYLGDLVCAWLLHDFMGNPTEELSSATLAAAEYWRERGWGWGEHLSDGYSAVMLNQLSAVLLFADHLPPEVRQAFHGLAEHLLAIEDAFEGGPRVPHMRCYAFRQSPRHLSFRDSIHDWQGSVPIQNDLFSSGGYGHLFWERGWHKLFPTRFPQARDLAFSCFGGKTALARVEADIRFGSVSAFPLMPSAEYKTWGLSWQCFPVAFWRKEGDWGFLRWRTVGQGQERCHPTKDKGSSYLDNALNHNTSPPITGQTFALQRGDAILVLRRMPLIVDSWDSVGDGLTLVEPHFTDCHVEETPAGWRLSLAYTERVVTVDCFRLPGGAKPVWTSGGEGASWIAERSGDALRGARGFLALWLFHFGADAGADTVRLMPEQAAGIPLPRGAGEEAGIVKWSDAEGEHAAAFDPLDAKPLRWVG